MIFCATRAESLELEPIVVTKKPGNIFKTFLLSCEEFSNYASSSLIETLKYAPVDMQSRSLKGGIQTDFSLRGSNFQGVAVLLDGLRVNDPQTAHHNSDIPFTQEDVEKIEVLPGTSASVYGLDAVGGAINFVLKEPQANARILELKGGQHQSHSELFSASQRFGNAGIRVSVEDARSDGFHTDTDFEKFTSSFSSSVDLPDGQVLLNFGYQDKEFGAYDFYTPGRGFLSKEWTKTYLSTVGLETEKLGVTIKPVFLWRRHKDKFLLDKTLTRSNYVNYHRTDTYLPGVTFEKKTAVLGKIALNAQFGKEKIKSTNLGTHERVRKSISLSDEKEFSEKLSTDFTWRFDDFNGQEKIHTASFKARYRLNKTHCLNAGFSRNVRLPSFTELFYSDPTTVGNPGLSAEKSLNYEAGYEAGLERIGFGITFFLRQEEDFIDWAKFSASDARWQALNISDAQAKGAEVFLKLKINDYFAIDSNYAYIDKGLDDGGLLYKYGPNFARHLLNTLFIFDLPFGKQTFGISYKKKPLRDGWCLAYSRLSYDLAQHAEFFIEANNIFDVEYEEIEGIPQPGRWVEAGVRVEW